MIAPIGSRAPRALQFRHKFSKNLRPLILLDGICRRARWQDFRAGVTLVFAQGFLRYENDLIGMTLQGPEKPYAAGIFGDAEPRINSSRARARNATRVPRFCATHQHLGKNPFHVSATAMADISRHAAQACRRISLRPVIACVSLFTHSDFSGRHQDKGRCTLIRE